MTVTKKQMLSSLENLHSVMETVSILLDRYGRKDKSSELKGAQSIVEDWIKENK